MKKEARKPEEVKKANLQKAEAEQDKITTLNKTLAGSETYNISSLQSKDNTLLGFQGGDDPEEGAASTRGRGGGRGGRGRGGRTEGTRGGRQGRGAKTNLLAQNEDEYPSL